MSAGGRARRHHRGDAAQPRASATPRAPSRSTSTWSRPRSWRPCPACTWSPAAAAVEATFKNTEVFSSEGFLELGNVRPLIPLSVDPPRHLKYRKILDPIFAPRQMDAIEDDVTARVNHFIDQFDRPRRVPLHPRVRRAVPVGGVPRPDGPAVGGARHVPPPEGRHHPSRRRSRWSRRSVSRSSATSARSSTRTSTPSSTSALEGAEGRHPHPVQHRGDRRRAAHARGDPRHLLPVLHRRSRHGDRLAHVLLRVPRRARRPPPPDRRAPRHHPERGRGAAALGDAGAERAAHGHDASARSPATPIPAGIVRARERGRRQRRPGRVRRRRWTCASTARSTATSRSAAACTAASARTWPAASCGSRCASGTGASPSTRSSPASSCSTRAGLRMVENLELVWPTK